MTKMAEPDPNCEGCKMGDCPVHGVRDGRQYPQPIGLVLTD